MKIQDINLYWHNYKFFPYEKEFAVREVQSLLNPKSFEECDDKLIVSGSTSNIDIRKLVYFSHVEIEKQIFTTIQFHFENGNGGKNKKRQNTRYSVHGLHEYKGKFNPQVVRSLFNIYNIGSGDKIIDPFCGSGTTLVEAAHSNINAKGTDINPLATYIANAKIKALGIAASEINENKQRLFNNYFQLNGKLKLTDDYRIQYLKKWFPDDILMQIEAFRISALELDDSVRDIFFVIISNLLRSYSFQEPTDLRIRRRFSPFPTISFIDQLTDSIDFFIANLNDFQISFGLIESKNVAHNFDIRHASINEGFNVENAFDFAITSPPYATALPYIDTQRLSLVWLNLISAKEITLLESELIGSREFKIKAHQQEWENILMSNKNMLPEEIHSFCTNLNNKLKPSDGFRKKALPGLLYRYFSDMRLTFTEVYKLLKRDKYFCLIVGHNHTKIGGDRTDINTPELLIHIGKQIGFTIHETIELDAYQRYGLNSSNSVQKETLIVFKK